jgi:hypothetical protein
METVNGTSLNGSSPTGSWLAPAMWSFDGTDLAIVDTGWIGLVHQKAPEEMPDDNAPPAVGSQPCPPPADFEAEQARLESAIAVANERVAAAKVRVAVCQAKIEAALRVELAEFQESVAELEGQHEETLAAVRAAAQAEVDRILTGARVNDAD